MVDIYWIAEKKKQGPISVSEAISRIQAGDFDENVSAWHRGCEDWMPLRELPAMVDFFKPKTEELASTSEEGSTKPEEESPAEDQTNDLPEGFSKDFPMKEIKEMAAARVAAVQEGERKDGEASTTEAKDASDVPMPKMIQLYMPSPVQRFFARIADYSFYLMLYFLVIHLFKVNFSIMLMPSNPLIWLPTILIEGYLIYRFRTTLGKKLMGVYIFSLNPHERFGLLRSLRRSFLVFFLGMGMMLFSFPLPLTVIAMGISFWKLRKRGISLWDMRAVSIPLQKTAPRFFTYFFTIMFIMTNVNIASYCFDAAWLPAWENYLKENIEDLKDYLPSSVIDQLAPDDASGVKQL